MSPDLLILYEHPSWFEPLFAALNRRGVAFAAVDLKAHHFDLAEPPPASVILNRLAMSAFLREPAHPIFYTAALLEHWQRAGATVLNGAGVISLDASKARQLSLIVSLGLATPATRAVHRAADLLKAAEGMVFPLLVKANIGGAGAGIMKYGSAEELAASVQGGTVPESIDSVLLLQDYVPPRGGTILRLETLAGKFLYALEVESSGDSFDLCPADACVAQPGRTTIAMKAVQPDAELVDAAERVAQAVGMAVGGVEVVIDDRDGVPRFYDINALSNFVASPMEVLGWDPHDRLVDHLVSVIEEVRA